MLPPCSVHLRHVGPQCARILPCDNMQSYGEIEGVGIVEGFDRVRDRERERGRNWQRQDRQGLQYCKRPRARLDGGEACTKKGKTIVNQGSQEERCPIDAPVSREKRVSGMKTWRSISKNRK